MWFFIFKLYFNISKLHNVRHGCQANFYVLSWTIRKGLSNADDESAKNRIVLMKERVSKKENG